MTQKRPAYSSVWSLPQGSIRDNQKGLNRVQAIAFNDQDQQVCPGMCSSGFASRVSNAPSHSSRVDRSTMLLHTLLFQSCKCKYKQTDQRPEGATEMTMNTHTQPGGVGLEALPL